MSARIWQAIDTAAHFLNCPAMLGRRVAAARWYHHVRLIPEPLFTAICDRYERSIWEGFPDEPVEKVLAAFDRGVKGITKEPGRRDSDA